MTDKPDLLPCPFCGGKNLSFDNLIGIDDYCIECDDCGLGQHAVHTFEGAVKSWNTRTAPLPEDKQKALDDLNRLDELYKENTDQQEYVGGDYFWEYKETIRASLQTPSVPVSVADALAEALNKMMGAKIISPSMGGPIYLGYNQSELRRAEPFADEALANYNKFKQWEEPKQSPRQTFDNLTKIVDGEWDNQPIPREETR